MREERQLEKILEKEAVSKSYDNLDSKTDVSPLKGCISNFYSFLFSAIKEYTTQAAGWLVGREKGDKNFERSYSFPYGSMTSSISIA